jgi:hypothetical protein
MVLKQNIASLGQIPLISSQPIFAIQTIWNKLDKIWRLLTWKLKRSISVEKKRLTGNSFGNKNKYTTYSYKFS